MKWILIIVLVIIVYYVIYRKFGNASFWKLVSKYPQQSYDFFTDNDCWFVIHPGERIEKPSDGKWVGPFFLNVPGIGNVRIYGKVDRYEQSEEILKLKLIKHPKEEPINLEVLKNQFTGRMFGKLVLHHVKHTKDKTSASLGTISVLPVLQQKEVEGLIDEFNEKVYNPVFWKSDCGYTFSAIIEAVREEFLQKGLNPSDEDLFNIFNIIVLNYAYSAEGQPAMIEFIKNSMNDD